MSALPQPAGSAIPQSVKTSFLDQCVHVRLAQLVALKTILPRHKRALKYQQILASVREVGLIEPPAVIPIAGQSGYFHILDGHLRIEALRQLGGTEVDCMLATEDDTYSYNRRIARLGALQEHQMVMRAMERGVSPARLAAALGIAPEAMERGFRLLSGICKEAVALLEEAPVPAAVFSLFRRMNPIRQIEAAELMIGQRNFSTKFVRAILAATPETERQRAPGTRISHASAKSMARLRREIAGLKEKMKTAQMDYGPDMLKLTIARTYLNSLLANQDVADWLNLNRPEYLKEFRRIGEQQDTEPVSLLGTPG